VATDARAGRAAPRSLIVTVYGAYARETQGWLSVSLVVRLLAELGVDEAAVRSSVSRLTRRGLLVNERRDGTAGYALSEQAREILAAGDRRIFAPQRGRLEDGWVVVAFSVPETERSSRHLLRSQLASLGFGTVAPGTWIAPAHLASDTRQLVERLGLAPYVELFRAEHLAFGDIRRRVASWWDLEALQRHYGSYVDAWEPVLRRWRRRRDVEPAAAFCDYVTTLTAWRRLPYLDPGLPAEVLPTRWQGARAADVFFALRARLEDAAHAHVAQAAGGQSVVATGRVGSATHSLQLPG
jgi:phenylacetic acid degradation operon negative regulatory protein